MYDICHRSLKVINCELLLPQKAPSLYFAAGEQNGCSSHCRFSLARCAFWKALVVIHRLTMATGDIIMYYALPTGREAGKTKLCCSALRGRASRLATGSSPKALRAGQQIETPLCGCACCPQQEVCQKHCARDSKLKPHSPRHTVSGQGPHFAAVRANQAVRIIYSPV